MHFIYLSLCDNYRNLNMWSFNNNVPIFLLNKIAFFLVPLYKFNILNVMNTLASTKSDCYTMSTESKAYIQFCELSAP